jgi:hypothetical protein
LICPTFDHIGAPPYILPLAEDEEILVDDDAHILARASEVRAGNHRPYIEGVYGREA